MEYLRAKQRTVLSVRWDITELYVTSGATWYGRADRIEEHGPFALGRSTGGAAIS
jgi:hypothetical protein